MIRENYGQIRKKSNQIRENFMWESRNAEKERNRENIWNRVRKSEQEKQEDADDTEEPDIKWRILQVLLGILLPAVPAAVFLAGGMELVIRLNGAS